MIRAIIVDDEAPARSDLAFQLNDFSSIDVVGQAENGDEAIALVQRKKPDLLFLDIQMPGKNGIQVAEMLLGEESLPYIVFVTAYDQYALRAFEIHATDYLLKPIDPLRLKGCIEKVQNRMEKEEAFRQGLEKVVQQMKQKGKTLPDQYADRIAVKRGARIFPLPVNEIRYVRVQDGVVEVSTPEGLRMTNFNTLDEIEEVLDPNHFFRVHRSFVVNLKKVREIVPLSNQTFSLKVEGEKENEIPLSRNQAKELRKIIHF